MSSYSLLFFKRAALTIGLALFPALTGVFGVNAQTPASVTVQVGTSLSTLPAAPFGVNMAVWDANLLDPAVPGLLTSAGINALRYPGGSTADLYNWQSNSIIPGQVSYANPNNTFDAFMGVVKKSNALPVITVNYGSDPTGNGGGTPGLAASWVQYANVTKGYGVKYWEIGNEVYGNGEYGSAWETDLHTAHDPATYGANVVQFASAMKAVDPTIKIGVVLAAPGTWPDGVAPDWNSNVLAKCGASIDFVVVHWYPQDPGSETDQGLLAAPQSGVDGSLGIAAMTAKLKSLLIQFAGAHAQNIEILVTETNSVAYDPGKQTLSIVNALFVADDMLTWLENGVTNVDVWDLHNGSDDGNISAKLFGTATYGDYGILSAGDTGEPAADTPFPTYYGIQMLSHLGKPGDTLVSSVSTNTLLAVHAVKQANGDLALLLINKDPTNTTNAAISLAGYTHASTATLYTYGKSSGAITSSGLTGLATSFTVPVAPYSLLAIVLTPGTTTPAPSFSLSANPLSLIMTQGASGSSTIAIAPAGGFSGSVALSASGLPAGVTASFSPASTTSASILTLNAASSAAIGSSTVTITGASGVLSAKTAVGLSVSSKPNGAGPAAFTGKASVNGPWFNEDDVALSTSESITAFKLTITVSTENVTFGGVYDTVGTQILDSHASGAKIVYTFTLGAGQMIYPGNYTFAAQMDGNGTAHPIGGDTWSVTYSSGGKTYTQSGAI